MIDDENTDKYARMDKVSMHAYSAIYAYKICIYIK